MPTPVMFNPNVLFAVMVNVLAPASNTIPFTSVLAERETLVVFEASNVAVSEEPFGTVDGVQFAAVFQSPEPGVVFHVALPAKAVLWLESKSNSAAVTKLPAGPLEEADLLRAFIGAVEQSGVFPMIVEQISTTWWKDAAVDHHLQLK